MDNLMLVKEYALKLDTSVQNIYKKIKLGELETQKINGKTYIKIDENSLILFKKIENSVENKEIYTIENSKLEMEKENIKLKTENEYLKKQIEDLKFQFDKTEKEKEQFRYQVNQKDMEIKTLLEKMENLNDRVIGLIEWKNTSWINRIFKKKNKGG